MKKIRGAILLENILSFFVCICPLLDIASFLFRKRFGTNYSISTFIRPIIPIVAFIYIFVKQNNEKRLKIFYVSAIYAIYAIVHLYLYNILNTKCAFGTLMHEAQYIINYSFMILNLFIFNYTFDKKNDKKLKIAIVVSCTIYIISIYVSIITKTSSTTYIEGIGYKGWIESGNSVSSIFVLSAFIIMSFIMKINSKKIRSFVFIIMIFVGIYLMILLGTRVGFIGYILAIVCFIIAQIYEKIITNSKIDNKTFTVILAILILLTVVAIVTGSLTLKRRAYLKNIENNIIDYSTGDVSNLTGDLTEIKNAILENKLKDDYMTEEQKQSIIDLYKIAKNNNISNTNTRIQQMIYHCMLIKNQKNVMLIIFGNGYLINTNELVWEMEFPAILLNFGLVGFLLYMVPFIAVLVRALAFLKENYKKIDSEFIILLLASILSFVLSTLSGYTFFNASSMIVIIVANTLLKNKMNN